MSGRKNKRGGEGERGGNESAQLAGAPVGNDLETLKAALIKAFTESNDKAALPILERLVEMKPAGYERMYLHLAPIYFRFGRFDESIESVTEFNKLCPGSLEAVQKMSHEILIDRRRHPQAVAVKLFNVCKAWVELQIARAPNDLSTFINAALIYMKAGKPEDAIGLLNSALQVCPPEMKPQLTHYLADTMLSTRPGPELISICEKLVVERPSTMTFSQLGSAYAQVDPTNQRAFEAKRTACRRAVQDKNAQSGQNRRLVQGWSPRQLVFHGDGFCIVRLDEVCIEGSVPILFDDVNVFGFIRGFVPDLDKGDWGIADEEIRVDEKVVLHFVATNHANYYHWLMESCARLVAALPFLQSHPNIQLLVPEFKGETIQDEILTLLGIDLSNVVRFRADTNVRYKFKCLYAVDVDLCKFHEKPSIWDFYVAPPQVQVSLRDHICARVDAALSSTAAGSTRGTLEMGKSNAGSIEGERGCKMMADDAPPNQPLSPNNLPPPNAVVYLKRDGPPRKVENESLVIEALSAVCRQQSLEFIVAEGKGSALDQAAIFRRAIAVVGPHGAGFANLIYCRPGALVIEFPLNPVSNRSYEAHAESLGHKHVSANMLATNYLGTYKATRESAAGIAKLLHEGLTKN